MISAFKSWFNKPARWYQFWQPESGWAGGAIASTLAGGAFKLVQLVIAVFS